MLCKKPLPCSQRRERDGHEQADQETLGRRDRFLFEVRPGSRGRAWLGSGGRGDGSPGGPGGRRGDLVRGGGVGRGGGLGRSIRRRTPGTSNTICRWNDPPNAISRPTSKIDASIASIWGEDVVAVNDKRVAIIGSGLIGRAWAIVFAGGGCRVALHDSVEGVAKRAQDLGG